VSVHLNTLVLRKAQMSQYLHLAKKKTPTSRAYSKSPTFASSRYSSTHNVCAFISLLGFLSILLDRMPPQIGDFISDAVYDGQLRSNPSHPITDTTVACHFIDVSHGKEQGDGTSWKVRPSGFC
jgi:hypothetical protein